MTIAIQKLNSHLENFCSSAAKYWNLDLNSHQDLKKIAASVLQLSDYFIANPEAPTPWDKVWAQQAYCFYFLPLNTLRVQRVQEQIKSSLDISKVENIIDFGAGLATAARALADRNKIHLIEKSSEAQNLVNMFDQNHAAYQWYKMAPMIKDIKGTKLAVFSYSLTELSEPPVWIRDCDHILILEPSTEQDGRKLMQLRQNLIEQGWNILAPCTHAQACPLLNESKHDWCHDRLHTELPEWLIQLEDHLPMKNRTLTVSYLLASKTQKNSTKGYRLTGDLLKEKGKDRQLICRNSDREFLSWMHKFGEHETFQRGELIQISGELKKVSNEIRISPENKIETL